MLLPHGKLVEKYLDFTANKNLKAVTKKLNLNI